MWFCSPPGFQDRKKNANLQPCLNICICDRLFLDQKRLNGVSLNGGRAPCAHEYYSMMWYTRDFYQAWCSFLLVKKRNSGQFSPV